LIALELRGIVKRFGDVAAVTVRGHHTQLSVANGAELVGELRIVSLT